MIKSKLISLVLGATLITSGISTSSASIIPNNIISSTENLISNFGKTTKNVVNYIVNSKKEMVLAEKELIKYENLSKNLISQNKQLKNKNIELKNENTKLKSENNNLNNQLSNIKGHYQDTKIASLYYALSNNSYFYDNPANCSIVIDHILSSDLGYSYDPYISDYLNHNYSYYSNIDFINNVSPNTIINEIDSISSLRGPNAMALDTDIINYILVNNLGYFYGNYYPQVFGSGLFNSSGNVSNWDSKYGLSTRNQNFNPGFATKKMVKVNTSEVPKDTNLNSSDENSNEGTNKTNKQINKTDTNALKNSNIDSTSINENSKRKDLSSGKISTH